MAKNFDGFIVLYQVAKCYYYHGISNTGFRRGGGEINMSSLLQWKKGLPETVYDKTNTFFNANADPEQKQHQDHKF